MEEDQRLEAIEREREAKRPRHHDLDLTTLLDDESPEELSSLRTTLQVVLQTPQPKGTSGDDAYVFDNHKEEEAVVTELKQTFKKLKIVARAKVTQDRVYSAAYHPEPTKDLIFFGGTYSTTLPELRRFSCEGRQAWATGYLGRPGTRRCA